MISKMDCKYLVIGVTGVTCGGKTTLSKKLFETIRLQNQLSKFKIHVKMLSQDDYFLDVDDKRHVWVEEIQHIHFDVITSLDMDKMYKDVQEILANAGKFDDEDVIEAPKEYSSYPELLDVFQSLTSDINILLLEGFSIFEHEGLYEFCNLRYCLTLDYEECKRRRLLRVYDPPDCVGYFDVCVWPEYQKYLKLLHSKTKPSVDFFESNDVDRIGKVFHDIKSLL